jgi:hypothetical protein
MTRMRFVFLNFSKLNLGSFVGCGVSSRHVLAMKGLGSVKFQLELGGYPKLAEVPYVPKLSMNILSISAF